jgi:hypothetical protein
MSLPRVLEPLPFAISAPEPVPDQEWEGELKGRYGICRRAKILVRAQMAFRGDLVSGQGVTPNFPYGREGGAFTLDGALKGSAFEIDLVMDDADFRQTTYACTGVMNAAEDEIEGKWTVGCLRPRECGCKGGGGVFRLQKVEV